MSRERSPTSFDEVAELYDRARPTYPPELLDTLVELARLRPADSVLEVGCGTGQATTALLERGLDVLCIERGPRLAELARRRGAAVEVAAFEEWEPRGRAFDAVVSFTAWHWLDPAVRYAKAAGLLRQGGALAVVSTTHVLLEDAEPAIAELQREYAAIRWGDGGFRPPRPGELADLRDEIDASGYFGDVTVRRYLWRTRYSAEDFVGVLGTYSDHLALDDDVRERLLAGLRRRIDDSLGGTVIHDYEFTLNVARRA